MSILPEWMWYREGTHFRRVESYKAEVPLITDSVHLERPVAVRWVRACIDDA